MKNIVIIVLLVVAGLAGYWFGAQPQKVGAGDTAPHAGDTVAQTATTASTGKKILYYRNPMGLPDTSPVPKKDPMG
ncbi:MAG: efflux RND transporter periplasmic adaptor subunit, partial [Rhodocyclaceae bacterium]